ncbi:MAG: (2Fe-2S)-binding protein, partial [Eubacterium sp.]|nr:(2Fe-2S)-binding protein [Eubacterium sp.]
MAKVEFFVDGVKIEAEEGTSVLQASLAAGVYIPHLCSHPDLESRGECKMCVVNIEGKEGIQLS